MDNYKPDKTFAEIVNAHKKSVYFLALNLSGNHQDAEDLSQDVFIKVHQSIEQFRGRAQLKTWLYRITVNTYIDKKRKKVLPMVAIDSTESQPDIKPVVPEAKSADTNPERQAEASLMQDHIKEALDVLSPKERATFVLKHFNGHSIKEIAKMIHTTEGTVKSHLFRAIRKMRDALSFYRAELGLEESR